jgi:transcriptional regulator with XRE-family HTH domain
VTAGGRVRPGSGGAATGRSPRGAQAVGLAVGRRIRLKRLELGLTQHELAELIGVTYQQLAKYEVGSNRVTAGRLHGLGEALGVEIGYFFSADVDADAENRGQADPAGTPGQRRMLLELVRHVAAIRDPRRREALCRLARDLAELGAGANPPVERPWPPPEPQSGPDR